VGSVNEMYDWFSEGVRRVLESMGVWFSSSPCSELYHAQINYKQWICFSRLKQTENNFFSDFLQIIFENYHTFHNNSVLSNLKQNWPSIIRFSEFYFYRFKTEGDFFKTRRRITYFKTSYFHETSFFESI
jgi:hypothetical protein